MNDDYISRVIVAVDVTDFESAKYIADSTHGLLKYLKIGMQAFYAYGERIIPYAKERGFNVFLDLKLCDIPNTVSSAIRSLSKYRFDLLTVHIIGGEKMLGDAVLALKDVLPDAGLLGVTVLTSLGGDDLRSIGFRSDLRDAVTDMCNLALKCNLYGIVCSAADLGFVGPLAGGRLKIITPGIRMPDDSASDQKRIETPKRAFESGADFIVMGRSVIAGDIAQNLERLRSHLKGG